MKRTILQYAIMLALVFTISGVARGQVIPGKEASILNAPGNHDAGLPHESGFYQGENVQNGQVPDTAHPWMHLINARHNHTNNHQLQIGASFAENDRLFFRKIATGLVESRNTQWFELAIRGGNYFAGLQEFSSNKEGYSSNNMLVGGSIVGIREISNKVDVSVALLSLASWDGVGAIGVTYNHTHNADMVFGVNNGYSGGPKEVIERMRIKANGNVGIGTVDAKSTLHVNGDELRITPTSIDPATSTIKDAGLLLKAHDAHSFEIRAGKSNDFNLTKNLLFNVNGGNVGIGTNLTSNPNNYRLAVNGTIGAKAVKVETTSSAWADYIFEPTYHLPSLNQVESFIKENKHLPDVPSAKEVETEGIDVAKMDATLLKKIEELTLYMIEMKKELQQVQMENKELKNKLEAVLK